MARAGEHEDGFLPINEHGLIGDLHTIALVGTNGTIDWYCCPAFDAPSVFGAILDCDRGGFSRCARRPTTGCSGSLLPRHQLLIDPLLTGRRAWRGPGLHADRRHRPG